MALKSAASSTAADQAVIVRYAAEVTKERDGLLQRSANLEAKWITAECKNVILRQRIADLTVRPVTFWGFGCATQVKAVPD
jgi:hypothetical protein